MAQISSIKFFNLNPPKSTLNRTDNSQISYSKFSFLNRNLSADTVSFKGGKSKKANNNFDINKLILDNAKRKNADNSFSYEERMQIREKISNKNKEFLPDLLTLNNNALSAKNITEILDYINLDTTDTKEFKEKLTKFKNLAAITKNDAYSESILPNYINEITSQGITDILKNDVLLRVPKNNFNPFPEAYNNTVKVFDEQIKKYNQTHEIKASDFTIKLKAERFMNECFASFLILGMVFDRSVFNELIYNRGSYINDIYMPRLRTLSQDDLKILRKVQTDAVTDKENKSGDIVSYEISLDDKISMLNLLYVNREIINAGYEGVNVNDYLRPVNTDNKEGNFVVDFQGLKIDLMDKVLKRIGIKKEVVDQYMSDFRETYAKEPDLKNHRNKFWDVKYVHLLNAAKGSLLRDIIVAATNGTYNDFLYKTGPVAEINKKNREDFEKVGINYDNWIKPSIPPISEKFIAKGETKEKTFTVKNWNRNPFESLFDGNYTTCCTGIDKNHGASFPLYLSNTCTTTLEVRTEKNKVIAMSRLLLAELEGRLSLIVENIEVNNKMAKHYLYDDKTKYKFREMIFDYVRAFAKHINNNTDREIPVYFSANYYKVKDIEKGLRPGKKYFDTNLIGEFPEKIYVNSYGALRERDNLAFRDEGDEFFLNLSDITRKAKPIFSETKNDMLNESDYNYADTVNFNR